MIGLINNTSDDNSNTYTISALLQMQKIKKSVIFLIILLSSTSCKTNSFKFSNKDNFDAKLYQILTKIEYDKDFEAALYSLDIMINHDLKCKVYTEESFLELDKSHLYNFGLFIQTDDSKNTYYKIVKELKSIDSLLVIIDVHKKVSLNYSLDQKPNVFCYGFDKPNLIKWFKLKTSSGIKNDKYVIKILKKSDHGLYPFSF